MGQVWVQHILNAATMHTGDNKLGQRKKQPRNVPVCEHFAKHVHSVCHLQPPACAASLNQLKQAQCLQNTIGTDLAAAQLLKATDFQIDVEQQLALVVAHRVATCQ